MGCMCNVIVICASVLGIVLVILGAVLGFAVLPDYVDSEIEKNTQLLPGTEQHDRFKELPFPLDFKIHFFHLKNHEQVMSGEQKPEVEEVGPIIYHKSMNKTIINEVEIEGTIEYTQKKYHELSPESEIEKTETVTILNTPVMGIFQKFEKITGDIVELFPIYGENIRDFLFTPLINPENYKMMFKMEADTVFHTVSVGDYAFDGYKFCDPSETETTGSKFICALIRLLGPDSMEIGEDNIISFSFFKHKDNAIDGTYTISSGLTDINTVGQIQLWNDAKTTGSEFWNEDGECNVVRGCDSTIYPPYNDETSKFTVFNTDICRTIQLEFHSEIEYEEIPGYKNYIRSDTLDMDKEENQCYCIKQAKNLNGEKECLPSGFLDMSNCLGAPILLSFPHFLWADSEYSNTVTGLTTNEEKHRIFIDMEPNTGSPLRGGKRIQLNMIVRPIKVGKDKFHFEEIKRSVMPLVWVDESVALPDFLVEKIKADFLDKLPLIEIVKWVLMAVGLVMFIAFGALYLYRRKKNK